MVAVMPASLIPSFLIYCFVGGITPGPANLCSLSAALRYGRDPALRQWRGLFCGFFLDSMGAVALTWLLGAALSEYVGMLVWVGAAYLLWMAWHMLRSSGADPDHDPAAPSFRMGLLVNLTNVKVIIFCITALAGYVLPYNGSLWALLPVGLFLPFTGPACNLVWLFAGVSLQRLFANYRKTVDLVMALSLALCAVSMVWPH
jgi:cysteine/O-acetylserine efflux protein